MAGNVLTEAQLDVLGDDIVFLANPPKCRVYKSTAFAHTSSGSWVAVTFDSERMDTDTMHSTVTNTSRITFTTAGTYLVGGELTFETNATGVRGARIRLGGATVLVESPIQAGSAAEEGRCPVSTLYAFTAGQYVELEGYQTSGGSLNVKANTNSSPEFWAVFLSL